MGKRKHKHSADKERYLRKKLKRIEKYLRRSYSPDSSNEDYRNDSPKPQSDKDLQSPLPSRACSSTSNEIILSDCDDCVEIPCEKMTEQPENESIIHTDSTMKIDTENTLSRDILEALGDPKEKEKNFGPNIPDEIAKRWGRVLVDGLAKEKKQEIWEKTLIPENFQLAKAPLLNMEISAVLSESVRNRDKLLEKSQNHLGVGIAGLTNLTAEIIEGDINKIQLLKKIADITQTFLDLHFENTKTRRRLVINSMDKKFVNLITGVKRDSHLFGTDLGERIRASKAAERSGLQIRRNFMTATTSNVRKNQGNWKGPPRSYNQRTYKQGGPKNLFNNPVRRRQPAGDHPQYSTKTTFKPRKA